MEMWPLLLIESIERGVMTSIAARIFLFDIARRNCNTTFNSRSP